MELETISSEEVDERHKLLDDICKHAPAGSLGNIWRGSVKARVMVLCDSPSKVDVKYNCPLAGENDIKFASLIKSSVKIDANKNFIFTNCVNSYLEDGSNPNDESKYRHFVRDPTSIELFRHSKIFKKIIMVVKPELIICLGKFSATLAKCGFDVTKMYNDCEKRKLGYEIQATPMNMVNIFSEEGQFWKVHMKSEDGNADHICRITFMRHPSMIPDNKDQKELWKTRIYSPIDTVRSVGKEERMSECGKPFIVDKKQFSKKAVCFDNIDKFKANVTSFMPSVLRSNNKYRLKEGNVDMYGQLISAGYDATHNHFNLHCITPEGYSASGVLKGIEFPFYVSPHRAFFDTPSEPSMVTLDQLNILRDTIIRKLSYRIEPGLYPNGNFREGTLREKNEWRKLFKTPYSHIESMNQKNKCFLRFELANNKRILTDGYQPKGRLFLKCFVTHQYLIKDVLKAMRWIISKYSRSIQEQDVPRLTHSQRLRVCNSNFSPEQVLPFSYGIRASHWLKFKFVNSNLNVEREARHLKSQIRFVLSSPNSIECLDPYEGIRLFATPIIEKKPEAFLGLTSSDHAPSIHCAMDIECGNANNKFPDALFDPVVCISNTVQVKNKFTKYDKDNGFVPTHGYYDVSFMLGDCDMKGLKDNQKIYCFKNEKCLLTAYFLWLSMLGPDRLIGHNAKRFDFSYLFLRAQVLGVPIVSIGRDGNSKIKINTRKFISRAFGERIITELGGLDGCIVVDTLEVYLREKKEPSNRLDALAQKYLNSRKDDVPYSAIWGLFMGKPEDRRRLINYCVRDARLCDQLVNIHCWDANMIEFARVNGVVYENGIYTRGQQVKVLGAVMHRNRKRGEELLLDSFKKEKYIEQVGAFSKSSHQKSYDELVESLGGDGTDELRDEINESEIIDILQDMLEAAEEGGEEEEGTADPVEGQNKRKRDHDDENVEEDEEKVVDKRESKQARLDLYTESVPSEQELYDAMMKARRYASDYATVCKKIEKAARKGKVKEMPIIVIENMENAKDNLNYILAKRKWAICNDSDLLEEATTRRLKLKKIQRERKEQRRIGNDPTSLTFIKAKRKKVAVYKAKLEKKLAIANALGQNDPNYKGATVMTPTADFHYKLPTICQDFASLYPSIMMRYNISPDTKLYRSDFERLGVDESMCHSMPDPAKNPRTGKMEEVFFIKKKYWHGIFPDAEKDLLAARKMAKKKMAYYAVSLTKYDENGKEYHVPNPNYDEILNKNYNGRQAQIKVICNSLYGAMGAEGKLGDKACASSVTSQGRTAINLVKEKLSYRYNATCVGGDTDSVFMQFGGFSKEQLEKGLNPDQKHIVIDTVAKAVEYSDEIDEFVNSFFKLPMKIEYEKSMYPMIIIKKKRYCGIIWEKGKNPRFFSKGMETVRRDSLPYTKETMRKVFDILFFPREDGESVREYKKRIAVAIEKVTEYVKERAKKLLRGEVDLSDLVLSKQLSKEVYANENAAHLQVKNKLIERGEDPPKLGERIPFIYVREGKNPITGEHPKGYEMAEHPDYAIKHDIPINYNHYFEKCFIKPIISVMQHILKNILVKKLSAPATKFSFVKKETSVLGTKRKAITQDEIAKCCERYLFNPSKRMYKEDSVSYAQRKYSNLSGRKFISPKFETKNSPLSKFLKVTGRNAINETMEQELCRINNTGNDWKAAYRKEEMKGAILKNEFEKHLKHCRTCSHQKVVICETRSCKKYYPRKTAEYDVYKSDNRLQNYKNNLTNENRKIIDQEDEDLCNALMDIEDMFA